MFEIAIVGIGCRFPGGVDSAESYWQFLLAKGDGIREVPADRWSLERFYDPDPDAPGRMYTRHGGFLTQPLWDFDPEYFGISPREAAIMDPQQRLVLEVAVEALDDAGLGARVGGRDVGVYVGGFTSDNQVLRHTRASRASINSHTATSGTFTMLSNRLSYVLDLHGPSMTIDTACSSSLVAVHEAAQAVARGECEVALAGGTNAMLQPETFVSMCKGRFLAPDGHCKTFDATADGYARGEGAGIVVLKPLAAARADGDRVYAVVRATGANQDGRTSGITVPNPVAQAALAGRVLAQSGLEASEIGYVEAHGTGTAIGDPLEIEALGKVYGDVPGRRTPLVVGSVKASIGHLEAAAGVASVIKAALTVHHHTVAPQAWLNELNPAIPFDAHRIEIPTETRPFPAGYERAAVAVNGFGYGGTNAHVVMTAAGPADVAPSTAVSPSGPATRVVPVSGRTDAAVREAATALAHVLGAAPDDAAVDAAIAASWSRRVHHPVRATVTGAGRDDLVRDLLALGAGEGRVPSRAVARDGERPVFVFSGMGPQWWGMARDLLTRPGVFADTAAVIDREFTAIAGWSIVDALLADEADSAVARTEIAQPANFLVQVALTAHLRALGVEPAAVVGHSVGEVSAAYVSGALPLHDALLVSYHRARLQATTAGSGSMLAVGLPELEAISRLPLDGSVDVAAVNSPSSVTLAGDRAALDALAERLLEEGVFARRLRLEVPYHSHLMDPVLAEIERVLADLRPQIPATTLYSSVTATQVTDGSWGASYWVDNVRRPVRFADTVAALVSDGHRVFLEVGPHPVLGGNIREILVRSGESGAVVSTLVRKQDDLTSIATAVGELYAAGAIDTSRAPGSAATAVPHVALPPYPWQRTRVWTEIESMTEDRVGNDLPPMLGERTDAAAPEWETALAPAALPWLPDHVVDGVVVLPGAAYLDAALSAAADLLPRGGQALADLRFVAPRLVDAHDIPVLRLAVEPTTRRFTVDSRSALDTVWSRHVTGRIVDGAYRPAPQSFEIPDDSTRISGDALYRALADRGLRYGPAFQGIVEAWVGTDVVIARVDAEVQSATAHLAHPATVDAALQCVAALVAAGADAPTGPVVPYAIAAVRRFAPLPADVRVAARRLPGAGLRADIALAGPDGTVVLELAGVEFRPVRPDAPVRVGLTPLWYEFDWERVGPPVAAPAAASPAAGAVVVVSLSARPAAAAQAVLAAHPPARVTTLAGPADSVLAPLGATEVARVFREALAEAPDGVTVVIVPEATTVAPSIDAVAGVLAVADVLDTVLDEQVFDGLSAARVAAVVVTEQAFAVPGDIAPVRLDHAAVVGLRRTLRNEQPRVDWRHVDIAADTPADDLVGEVLATPAAGAETADEVALRPGARLVLRLRRNLDERLDALDVAVPLEDPEASFRVEAPASMLFGDLALRAVPRRAPGPDQVEVRLLSAGLNYKDSAKVIGLLTERELAGTYFGTDLGMEAIGVVVRVGPGVTRFTTGDRLFVGVRDSLARYLTVDIDRGGAVSHAPSPWSDTDSALELPFLTAHHALVDTARVGAGDTVLVHGAAGGVGLAAVQVAKRQGARVIGTAGSPARREAVLAAGADVVLDSRSLDFVDEVRALTDGRGVDVVLNSAPGDVIDANLEVTAEFGRIIEIGKADIYGGGVVRLAPFDRNLSFTAIDIDRLLAFRRPVMLRLLETVNAAFESGWYVPLPTTVYPLSQLREAFEAVARGSQIGRVVLDFRDPAPAVRPERPTAGIRDDATYLVTGGFGAFGLATARWLAASGARRLVLVGRRGATTVAAKEQVAALEAAGVDVVEAALDVADAAAVDALVAGLATGDRPLRGVFHAAGVLDDRPFTQIDAGSLRTVYGPKATGAWNLHEATVAQGIDLDHFVLYSSASAITGNVPQAAYAAANTTLDALADGRRATGLPALSVTWGVLSGGMASSAEEVERYLATIGLLPLDLDLAATYLGEAMAIGIPHVGIIDIDWNRWGATHPASAGTTRFAEHVTGAEVAGSESARLRSELLALPDAQRTEVVAFMLAEQLAVVLGIPAESIDLDTPLPDLGMDSLMAVEMQARVNIALDIEVSALEFGRGGGLAQLAGRIVPQLAGGTEAAGAPVPVGA